MSSSSSSRSGSRPQPPSNNNNNNNSNDNSNNNFHQSAASYFSYPVTHVVSGLYRRLTDPPSTNTNTMRRKTTNNSNNPQVFTPVRTASPFQPPPLTPLTLSSPSPHLSRSLAEEIRLLVPPRLQLINTWELAYSLDRDGASLSTLYDNCREISARSPRAGYVLVIRDASPASSPAVFGAYMTDPPHPDSHYFGTGECFLWRASVLAPSSAMAGLDLLAAGDENQNGEWLEKAGFPLPPSADTTHAGRSTTLRGGGGGSGGSGAGDQRLAPPSGGGAYAHGGDGGSGRTSGTATPEQIRFKAFPYSGVNDYMMFCETGFLSLGGGDGHYGLWVDSSLEKGVSASCQTFGNEPLSDEGVKFDILGVEVWYVGS
ncbi:TLD-domain-containing protein [Aspergillus heteromorphus CBS 117.55]|uniref:Oxidation resistance protein 1 n=1 Tax=Aspergillus heteromorphus CBS 117.55 TaxID=1448321 RepID=A0A317X2V7_9EURO|nr:TLD-domain-containing protein [Aspergillus heteromorphus CBS 117.55]PWY92675.1 TLD-domain-containing protein [Aspergillus heteromorphus CBS 117.55]